MEFMLLGWLGLVGGMGVGGCQMGCVVCNVGGFWCVEFMGMRRYGLWGSFIV